MVVSDRMKEYFLASAEETISFGEKLASFLLAGDCLALVGDLGAGKTHLTQGVLRGLGYETSGSPTFALAHEYEGGVCRAAHFDLYRLESSEELLALGWDEYFEKEMIVVVEWADRFPELLPENTLWAKLETAGEGRRLLLNSDLEV